jgi:ribonuclease BN (tRNA processing enzyme)
MKITVLGGCGAWPAAGQACSGYLVEHAGFRLLIDPGYATLPRLLEHVSAADVHAVLISHGHPDHCADLNPLLRARALQDVQVPALPVFALPGALDAVLALDGPRMHLGEACAVQEFVAGDRLVIGPFDVETRALPHFVPNAGFRLTADGTVLMYTGDTGPSLSVVELAGGADLLLAEATYLEQVPENSAGFLSSAGQAGEQASKAAVKRLLLTHLWPGTNPAAALAMAGRAYNGWIGIAGPGVAVDLT